MELRSAGSLAISKLLPLSFLLFSLFPFPPFPLSFLLSLFLIRKSLLTVLTRWCTSATRQQLILILRKKYVWYEPAWRTGGYQPRCGGP